MLVIVLVIVYAFVIVIVIGGSIDYHHDHGWSLFHECTDFLVPGLDCQGCWLFH